MEVNTNKNHKKVDLSTLDWKKIKKNIKRIGGSVGLSLMVLSGAVTTMPTNVYAAELEQMTQTQIDDLLRNYENAEEYIVVEIPAIFKYSIVSELEDVGYQLSNDDDITVGMLRKLETLSLPTHEEGSDLSWLNYCSNLESLSIMNLSITGLDDIIALPNLKSLSLSGYNYLDLSNANFLVNSKNIKTLRIFTQDCIIDNLENMDSVENLIIDGTSFTYVDFNQFKNLKNLEIVGQPYDVAINISKDNLNDLRSKGINVYLTDSDNDNVISNDGTININNIDTDMEKTVLSIDEQLNDVVNSLGVDENSTDKEKIDAILIYCIENYTYDEEISQMLNQGVEIGDEHLEKFYKDGNLYGCLNSDTQICGNYAAMVHALSNRLGLKNYGLESSNHAWNLVEIDGNEYYYDATWMDGQTILVAGEEEKTQNADGSIYTTTSFESESTADILKSGDTDEISRIIWYEVDPDDVVVGDQFTEHDVYDHTAYVLPEEALDGISGEVNNTTEENKVEESSQEEKEVTENTVSTLNTEQTSDKDNKDNSDITKKKFKIKLGTKEYVIGGAVLVALVSTITGGAVISHKKKEERKRSQRLSQSSYYSSYTPYDYNNYSRRPRR